MREDLKQLERSIQPVVKIISIDGPPNNFAYWQSQPYSARLAALEEKDILVEDQIIQIGYAPRRIDIITILEAVELKN